MAGNTYGVNTARKKQLFRDVYVSNEKTDVRQVLLYIRWIVIWMLISGCAKNYAGDFQSNKVAGKKEKPLIVTTIRPLTLIAQAVVGNDLEIKQLLPDGEIPHHYSLRISDRRLIEESDILIWIGENMENFIGPVLDQHTGLKVIEAGKLEEINWPDTESGERDYHLWLNPQNALAIAKTLATEIGNYKSIDSEILQERLVRFEQEIKQVDREIKQKIKRVQEKKYIVDHDALRHFEYQYNIENSGHLRDGNGLKVSVKEMARLMAQQEVCCVIGDNESRLKEIEGIANKLRASMVVIDMLAIKKEKNSEEKIKLEMSYPRYIKNISEQIFLCLKD